MNCHILLTLKSIMYENSVQVQKAKFIMMFLEHDSSLLLFSLDKGLSKLMLKRKSLFPSIWLISTLWDFKMCFCYP